MKPAALPFWVLIALIVCAVPSTNAQQPSRPAGAAKARTIALPPFGMADIDALRSEIARSKPKLEGGEARLTKRLAYLVKLEELLTLAAEIQKDGGEGGVELGQLLAPRPALVIDYAAFGDLRHKHTCDATPYLEDKCKLRPEGGTIDNQNCLIDVIEPMKICGRDPSPQGKKELYVEWSCAGISQAPRRAPQTGPLRLVCHLHRMNGDGADAAKGADTGKPKG